MGLRLEAASGGSKQASGHICDGVRRKFVSLACCYAFSVRSKRERMDKLGQLSTPPPTVAAFTASKNWQGRHIIHFICRIFRDASQHVGLNEARSFEMLADFEKPLDHGNSSRQGAK